MCGALLKPDKPDNPETLPLWTVKDVAKYLRVEEETVRAMARRGDLPGYKVGRVWRFDRRRVQAMVKSSQSIRDYSDGSEE